MLNGKDTVICLIVGWIKIHSVHEWIFSRTDLGEKVKVELNLSNYATKADLKNTTGIDK